MANGNVMSYKVNDTLLARRVVAAVSGTANTVQYPESSQNMFLGITLDTVLDTTSAIPVQQDGIAKLHFNQTITTGQLVGVDTAGRGIVYTMPNTTTSATLASAYIGVLVGPSVDASATIADVNINPGFLRTGI